MLPQRNHFHGSHQFTEEQFIEAETKAMSYKDLHLLKDLRSNKRLDPVIVHYSYFYESMSKWVAWNAKYGFALALSLYSPTIQNYEFMNKENSKGWYTSDGMLHLYTSDQSHFSDNYQCTVDPTRRPGTTVLQVHREDEEGMTTLARDFIHGVSNAKGESLLGMDFVNCDSSLEAKKAWYYAHDALHCLGAGIRQIGHLDIQAPIETIIENRKVTGQSFDFYINGSLVPLELGDEICFDSVSSCYFATDQRNAFGVHFHEIVSLHAKLEAREGSWFDINGMEQPDVYKNTYLVLWIEHDEIDDSYAYSVYPNRRLEDFLDVVENSPVKILSNTSELQVYGDATSGRRAVVAYSDEVYDSSVLVGDLGLTRAGAYLV